jgi:glycosyltransferase involved in cell wall biosynthesis
MVVGRPDQIAIIIPVYNAGNNIAHTYSSIRDLIKLGEIDNPQIIFVNDGSVDQSLRILLELAQSDPAVHILDMEINSGQNAALYSGIAYADASIFMTIDDDFPFQPAEVASFIKKYIDSGKKISFGIPHAHKNVMAYFLKVFFPLHWDVKYHSSLRIFDSEVRSFILKKKTLYPALFLGIQARDMSHQMMYSYIDRSESRYGLLSYISYYRAEIILILSRLSGGIFLLMLILALYDKTWQEAVYISFAVWAAIWLTRFLMMKDYTKIKYRVSARNRLKL